MLFVDDEPTITPAEILDRYRGARGRLFSGAARPVVDTGIDLKRHLVVELPKPINPAKEAARIIRENLRRNRLAKPAAFVVAAALVAAGRAAAERTGSTSSPRNRKAATVTPLETILRRISRATGVTVHEICSDRRTRRLCFARQAVMYWACRRTRLALPQIGRRLGHRDHTTVLHGKEAYVDKRAHQGRNLRRVA